MINYLIEQTDYKVGQLIDQCQYSEALILATRACQFIRLELGANHPELAWHLNNLADLHRWMGDFDVAMPLYQEALQIYKIVFGEEHPNCAMVLNNLGFLSSSMGDYKTSEYYYNQAIEIKSKTIGENDPSFAISLNNLALLYNTKEEYGKAEKLFRQSLEIRRRTLGVNHHLFAQSLHNLAAVRCFQKDFREAIKLCRQAQDIWREIVGEAHPDFAYSLSCLATLHSLCGEFEKAGNLYHQANLIFFATLGEYHPVLAECLNNMATVLVANGGESAALTVSELGLKIDNRIIGKVFSICSERQRTAYLTSLRKRFDEFLSLVSQHLPESVEAMQSALSLVLWRKAIEAEALIAQRDAVLSGKYPHLKQKLQELSKLREQIALKTLAGAGQSSLERHNQILAEWESQKESLESELARQIPEINLEQKLRAIDREVVALALPEDSALIEFVRFDVFDFKAIPARGEAQWKPAHYLAFILPAGKPDDLQMIDLGEAEGIDRMIATFRAAVTGEKEGRGIRDLGAIPDEAEGDSFVEQGKLLRLAVFDKLLNGIGKHKQLFIAPDGDLSRLPFEILPTDDGGFLLDKYRMSYLGVGRDVIRFGAASSGQPTAPIVAADPDFNLTDQSLPKQNQEKQPHSRFSRDFERGKLHFAPLPGTKIEGESIAKMLGVEPMLKGNALESRLKSCQSPRILHIATHGFFLQDQQHDLNKEQRDLGMIDFGDKSAIGRFSSSNMENPLLRSGLALAGVNTWLNDGSLPEEAEDGILTAEDVTGLDLLATELVVLSACETGIGEVRIGEGVFGLRRAFVLAGAKTLVMSLWKVPDKQTQELMEIFYQKILNGQPRSEALREAQLEIRKKNPHPLYWGAFICQGDPNELEWKK